MSIEKIIKTIVVQIADGIDHVSVEHPEVEVSYPTTIIIDGAEHDFEYWLDLARQPNQEGGKQS